MTPTTRTHSRRAVAGLCALTCAGSVLGTATVAAARDSPHRGDVISVTRVQHLSRGEVFSTLDDQHFDASGVKFGVDAYRISYRTIGVDGRATRASGLLSLPRNDRRRLPTVSYAHGTTATKRYAPSVDDGGRSVESLTFASAGYGTVAPDYLGLGTGPGHHPYLHVRTEISASVDLLTAARTVTHDLGRSLDRRILITGFSQGGAVAMALAHAIDRGAAPGLQVRAVAPISGPYELERAEFPAILDGRLSPVESAYYLAYFFTSWNRIYHLYDDPAEAFRAPYDRAVEGLFDGHHTDAAIVQALPASRQQLLTPAFLAQLRNPHGRFAAALRVNDGLCRWHAHAPVRIFAAHGDQVVAFENAQRCHTALVQRGASATLVDLGALDHVGSGMHGLALALRWFDQLGA